MPFVIEQSFPFCTLLPDFKFDRIYFIPTNKSDYYNVTIMFVHDLVAELCKTLYQLLKTVSFILTERALDLKVTCTWRARVPEGSWVVVRQ